MPGELVIDASVAAKVFFTEQGSGAARDLAMSGVRFIAPDLITLEIASVAAKYVRRDETTIGHGLEALRALPDLIDHLEPLANLGERALALSVAHGFSVYDASYLALAKARGRQVVTADEKLARRASQAGLGDLVRNL